MLIDHETSIATDETSMVHSPATINIVRHVETTQFKDNSGGSHRRHHVNNKTTSLTTILGPSINKVLIEDQATYKALFGLSPNYNKF